MGSKQHCICEMDSFKQQGKNKSSEGGCGLWHSEVVVVKHTCHIRTGYPVRSLATSPPGLIAQALPSCPELRHVMQIEPKPELAD